MIDIKIFRETPDLIKDSERKRFREPKRVDEVIKIDEKWRNAKTELQELKHKQNKVSKEISALKMAKGSIKDKVSLMKDLTGEIALLESKAKKLLEERDKITHSIGNILHESVPLGKTDEDNKVVRKWGKPKKNAISHADIIEKLDIVDIKKASEVSGARYFFMKNEGVILQMALARFVMDFLSKKGFTPLSTPFILRKEYMQRAAQLSDFDEQLYEIKDEESYLIATAEQPIAAYHADDVISEKELPLKYVGFSTNFRKEAGSHGKDTKGIFRVHQFDKVEQFVFCNPEDSWKWHEKMLENSEEILKKLEIPYQVVILSSGDTNNNCAKTYDLECWFPSQNKYRELSSVSNCTDYQARKMNVKMGAYGGEKEYLHMLNGTGIAVQRAICALIENHQQKDGSVKIPLALQKYTGFKKMEIKNV